MQYLNEKVAYLKGLSEGLGLKESSKEGKLLNSIIDVLDDFADAIVTLDEGQAEIEEYIETIDDDLASLEDEVLGEELKDAEKMNYIEFECPKCGEIVEIDDELLYDDASDILCPNCDEIIIGAEDECCQCSENENGCDCNCMEEK